MIFLVSYFLKFQNEYRQVNKNSKHIADFSLKTKDSTSKTHFFSNSNINLENKFLDQGSLFLKLEKISNDNYAAIYSLEGTSPIISDTSTLESSLEFSGIKNDFYITKYPTPTPFSLSHS